jgi:hypothetical protein
MKKIWTSMVEVSGTKGNLILRGHAGAYVWVAAEALDIDSFKENIEAAFQKLDLALISFEEIRSAEEAESTDSPSEELLTLILKVRGRQHEIAYGSFYCFTHDQV